MAALVNTKVLGPAQMYGVSIYDGQRSFVLDKSAKYTDAVFFRLQRKFAAASPLKDIAEVILAEEMHALGFLGLEEIPPRA